MNNLKKTLTAMENRKSIFENYIRKLPVPVLKEFLNEDEAICPIDFEKQQETLTTRDSESVLKAFPNSVSLSENKILKSKGHSSVTGKRVAILFSGGPASGGHNVIVGVKKALGSSNTLLATKAGPKGLLKGDFFEITDEMVNEIINTGGFDFMGSDRTKIKTEEQFAIVKKVVVEHKIDAIIVAGGDDSNTNAAILAEVLYPQGVTVVGVPKTIDGDLQLGELLPISFGFNTATKIYAEMVGNILQDTASSLKYWHFVKIMGRAASHVALEVALQTRPAYTIISEEVLEKNKSLSMVVDEIAHIIKDRAEHGLNHGLVLIPEGFIEFIPEMRSLIFSMDEIIGHHLDEFASMTLEQKKVFISNGLELNTYLLYSELPELVQDMLLSDRDSHGNLPVSQIPTELLIIEMVSDRLKKLQETSSNQQFKSYKFNTLSHFFGYEGRCGAPTLFDAAYCLNLGLIAGSLALSQYTGYMASLTNIHNGGTSQAVPLTGLMNIERRQGHDEFVIEKALVKLDSPAFQFFEERRNFWAKEDLFTSPGPRQLTGSISKEIPISVALNLGYDTLNFDLGKEICIH